MLYQDFSGAGAAFAIFNLAKNLATGVLLSSTLCVEYPMIKVRDLPLDPLSVSRPFDLMEPFWIPKVHAHELRHIIQHFKMLACRSTMTTEDQMSALNAGSKQTMYSMDSDPCPQIELLPEFISCQVCRHEYSHAE
jgi:hypothetical protein